MAPLAPLSTKSGVSSNMTDEFDDDMIDDLLDAPVPTKSKKKSKKSKKKSTSTKNSKKSSSKNKEFTFDDAPLSPNLGNSMDELDIPGTFTVPSNVTDGDLDDSILGGECI